MTSLQGADHVRVPERVVFQEFPTETASSRPLVEVETQLRELCDVLLARDLLEVTGARDA